MQKTISDRITSLFLPISVILMEVFWGYPWFIWTGKWQTLHWQRPALSMFSLLGLVAVSFVVTRFLINREWSSRRVKLSISLLGLILVCIIIRIEYGNNIEILSSRWFAYIGQIILDSFSDFNIIVFAFPTAAYFWWRGMLLGRRQDYNYIHTNIVLGAGSFLILGLIWWGTIGSASFSDMAISIGPYVAGFFFFGFAGTAFNNLRNVQKRMPHEETHPIPYSRWLLFILSMAAIIITIGGAITTASSIDFGSYVKRLWLAIIGFFETVFSWLAVPIEFVLKYVLMPFEWIARNIIEFLLRLLGGNRIPPDEEGDIGGEIPEIIPGTTSEDWLVIIKWTLFIIVIIVVTILIARTITKHRQRRPDTKPDFEVVHESLWSWRLFIDNIILFLKRFFGRFLPQKTGQGTGSTEVTTRAESVVTTMKIREIFRHLLRDTAKMGIGRYRAETPFEYARRLSKTIPDSAIPVQELTDLYVNIRYSNYDATAIQVAQANGLWQQIRTSLKIYASQ